MKFLIKFVILVFFIGLILTVVAFASGVDLTNINDYFIDDEAYGDQIEYVTTTSIDALNIDVETRNIYIVSSTNDSIVVTYYAHEKDTWNVEEVNGTLNVVQSSEPIIFSWFNFKRASNEVLTVYIAIPDDLILDYSMGTATGEVIFSQGPDLLLDLSIDANIGDVIIENKTMESLRIRMNTGDISLNGLVVSGILDAKTDIGDLDISESSSDQFILESSTGDVAMNNLDGNLVDVSSDTGDIHISDANILGVIELSTSTGNVTVTDAIGTGYDISSSTGNVSFTSTTSMDIRYNLETSIGTVRVNGDNQGTKHTTTTGAITLKVDVSTGNITVNVQD
ncbi:MAG: DUF4097 domain-containing protein [Firmicutes bacterium]|nr:DUF4097 domain-containing protein [Bacillota bacterium]